MNAIWEEASATPAVIVDTADGVAVVTLNRPDKLNAWTPAMGTLYFDILENLARSPDVRAILVRGSGRGFCAGADISGLANIAAAGGHSPQSDSRPYWHPLSIGKPIVAAIHGACFGVGFQQALCCDIRILGESARLSTAYARRGLIGEVGITWILTRIVGVGAAADYMLSGRDIDSAEALASGLANRVVPDSELDEVALAYCRSLASTCSPWSMRMIKAQLYADLALAPSAAYAQADAMLAEALSGPDFAEGIAAFRDRRPVRFEPLPPDLAIAEFPPV